MFYRQGYSRLSSSIGLFLKNHWRQQHACSISSFPQEFLHSSSGTNNNDNNYNTATSYEHIPADAVDLIEEYAQRNITFISLSMLLQSGKASNKGNGTNGRFGGRIGERVATQRMLIEFANFLRNELPIRLAHRVQDLEQVPMMRDMPSVQAVKGVYIQSFLAILQSNPIETAEDEYEFGQLLESLYAKHSNILIQMAKGAYELRQAKGMIDDDDDDDNYVAFEELDQCHDFLDRFYSSRVGIRVLAGQYLALRENSENPSHTNSDYIGMICLQTSPYEIVQMAAQSAKKMCWNEYGHVPQVNIRGRLDLTFPYIPTHLHYILLELLKNALRATTERWLQQQKQQQENDNNNNDNNSFGNINVRFSGQIPPVEVIIADGTDNEDVVIKIADEGGGIKRSQMKYIWSYLYTTANPKVQEAVIGGNGDNVSKSLQDHSLASPIAGLGYGLPISRAYARYFGGDLNILSMEGYGTDAFVYLRRLGDSKKPLPV